MNKLKLGLLEFGYHRTGVNSMKSLDSIFEYALAADKLGFTRLWFTEHHDNFKTSPWSSPEILLPLFLGMTKRIKVGIAGILINYHSPYVTALNYKLLANLFPGRVDLGFANGTPPESARKLMLGKKQLKKNPDNYLKHIQLISEIYNNEVEFGMKNNIIFPPVAGDAPDLFILGSFFKNTAKAIELKLNYSKSIFHDAKSLIAERDTVQKFKEDFYAKHSVLPQVNIAVPFICAKTKKQALKIGREAGSLTTNSITGTVNQLQDELYKLQQMFDVDEFVLLDQSYDPKMKIETLHLLQEKFIK